MIGLRERVQSLSGGPAHCVLLRHMRPERPVTSADSPAAFELTHFLVGDLWARGLSGSSPLSGALQYIL